MPAGRFSKYSPTSPSGHDAPQDLDKEFHQQEITSSTIFIIAQYGLLVLHQFQTVLSTSSINKPYYNTYIRLQTFLGFIRFPSVLQQRTRHRKYISQDSDPSCLADKSFSINAPGSSPNTQYQTNYDNYTLAVPDRIDEYTCQYCYSPGTFLIKL